MTEFEKLERTAAESVARDWAAAELEKLERVNAISEKENIMNKIISTTKGSYGQWIVTAEIGGCFVSRQYHGYLRREAIQQAKEALRLGTFEGRI